MVSVTIVDADITIKFNNMEPNGADNGNGNAPNGTNTTIYSPVCVQPDDSIMQLKKKILNELGINSRVAYHEMYIYTKTDTLPDFYKTFMQATGPKTNYLNRVKFMQLLYNFGKGTVGADHKGTLSVGAVEGALEGALDKEIFMFTDLLKASKNKSDKPCIGLGVETASVFFSPDPKKAIETSPKIVAHNDYDLLMTQHTQSKHYYVCLAANLLGTDHDDYIIKTYFPLLASKSIFSKETLEQKREALLEETRQIMDPRHFTTYKIVDLFYRVAKEDPIQFVNNGIRNFKIALNPTVPFLVPLESLFKNIHATEAYKLIKLNLGVRRENVYRVYSDKISKTGRKIPALPRNIINSLIKNIGRHKQISVYVAETKFVINIEADGQCIVSGDLKQPASLEELQKLLTTHVNPFIEMVNGYLQNSGYKLDMFNDLYNNNVEILSLNYVASIGLRKKIELKSIMGCLTSLFDIIDDDVFKTAELRFKRVANYRDMDQQTLLITETLKRTGKETDAVDALIKNHGLTMEEAMKRFTVYLREVATKNVNAFGQQTQVIEVIENPGLPIYIKVDMVSNTLNLTVDEVSHLSYLNTLSVYFSAIVKMLQEPSKEVKNTCLKPEALPKATTKQNPSASTTDERITDAKVPVLRAEAFEFSPVSPDKSVAAVTDKSDDKEEPTAINTLNKLNTSVLEERNALSSSSDDFVGVEQIENEDGVQQKSSSSSLDLTGIEIEGGAKGTDPKGTDPKGTDPKGTDPKDSDTEDFEEDTEDSDTEDTEEDAGKPYQQKNKDIAKNSNPFLLKMQKLDPAVFLQSEKGRTNVYARTCQSTRQPVILTAEEKAKIDKKAPGSYTKAMKFGSTPDKEHYFICPRFWCSKTNTSLTEAQVKNGECDPEYLHEFKNPKNPIEHVDEKGNYIDHYPGFVKNPKLKYCMPCCFASQWDTWKKDKNNKWVKNKQIKSDTQGRVWKRKAKGEWKMDTSELEKVDNEGNYWIREAIDKPWKLNTKDKERPRFVEKCEDKDGSDSGDDAGQIASNIFNPEKRELPKGRIGYLPYAAQHFFNIRYEDVVNPNNASSLKPNAKTYLKYGIEQTDGNSLLACLADVAGSPSVAAFRKTLADSVSLADFIQYGNGGIATAFKPPSIIVGDEPEVIKEAGKIVSATVDAPAETPEETLEKMAALEVYKDYLKTDRVECEFIWDLMAFPNKALWQRGLNLVIMDILNNDVTDNIEIVCPKNTYAKYKFDIDKPTLFLLRQEDQYNPVYLYKAIEATTKVVPKFEKTFDKHSDAPSMQKMLKTLNQILNNYCGAKPSNPLIYKYEQPVLLHNLIDKIKGKYRIKAHVVNYQGKTIALHLQGKETTVYVPCFPTAYEQPPHNLGPVKRMDDTTLWNSYERTRNELQSLGIPELEPMAKIMENGLVVGLLTKTNQVVPVTDPDMPVLDDGLPTMNEHTALLSVDTVDQKPDKDRVKIMQNIYVETNLYTLFRSTVKSVLEREDNYRYRDTLMASLKKPNALKTVAEIIVNLVQKTVDFVEFDARLANRMANKAVYVCQGTTSAVLKDGCRLLLPIKNMVNPERDNRLLYFYRIADEILRYGQYSNYILNPKQFLNTGSTTYNVDKTEFIALESSLSSEYYSNQTEFKIQGEISYELATTEKGQSYPNDIIETEKPAATKDLLHNCIDDPEAKILGNKDSVYWIKHVFKPSAKEIIFKATIECSFGPLLRILPADLTEDLDAVRNIIWMSYREHIDDEANFAKVIKVLREKQGKNSLLRGIDSPDQFAQVVMSDSYYCTTLDIFFVAQHLNLPVVLFTNSAELDDMQLETNWSILGLKHADKSGSTKFHFIRGMHASSTNSIPKHRMLNRTYTINELGDFKQTMQTAILGNISENKLSIDEWMKFL